MPKEVIRSTSAGGQNQLHIGWTRNSYVQMATTDGTSEESGHFVHMNRRTLNETIRKLRHARDQAFGRDE